MSRGLIERLANPSTLRAFSARANVLLPGLYAWGTTVAVPAASPRAPGTVRVTALAALVALVLGPLVAPLRPGIGRALGIHGFLGLSLVTWGLLSRADLAIAGNATQATLGALGWMVYAFGWGELRGRGSVPEDDPRVVPGAPLPARGALARSVTPVFAVGVIAAVVLMHLAFRVSRPVHAVFGHAVALVAGLLLVGAAARVALDRTPRALPAPGERLSGAATPLAALLVLLGLGALYVLLWK